MKSRVGISALRTLQVLGIVPNKLHRCLCIYECCCIYKTSLWDSTRTTHYDDHSVPACLPFLISFGFQPWHLCLLILGKKGEMGV